MTKLTLFEHSFKAMGSPCNVSLYCSTQAEFEHFRNLCVTEVARLEAKYSRYLPDSLVSTINNAAGSDTWTSLDKETHSLLGYATVAYEQSEGLFDITSGVLRHVWNFRQPQIPEKSRLDACLRKIGWPRVQITQQGVRLPAQGMELDLGGIVKEYAADTLASLIRANHVMHGLIDLGGDMTIIGPHPDGSPWEIGIRSPDNPTEAIARISLMSGGLASSGSYARCFEIENERYSHLLNPKTGWPVKGLQAASVWAPQCVVAGSVATIAMLNSPEQALDWLRSCGVNYVCMETNGNIIANT